jgi:Na+/phosphate symporter
MEPHLKTAQAHRFLALAYIFLTVLGTAGLWLLGHIVESIEQSKVIAVVLPLLVGSCILIALHLVVASGAKRKKPWARTMTNLVGIVMLFAFPVGTVVGTYLIWTGVEKWGNS